MTRRLAASLLAVVLGFVAVAGSSTGIAPSAAAQEAPEVPTALRLVSQSMQVAEDGELSLRIRVEGTAAAEAELAIIARQPVRNRGEVREVIDGRRISAQADRVELPLSAIPVVDGQLVITVPTENVTSETGKLRLRNPGLYPITLELRRPNDDDALATMTLFVERTGDIAAQAKVRTVLMVRLDAAPTLQPSGTTLVSDTTRAELDRLIDLLELTTNVPLTVVLRPELLEGLARSGFSADAERLARLRAAVANHHEIVPTTYVELDPNRAVDLGLGTEFAEQLIRGEDTLQDQLGLVVGSSIWALDGPIDADALDLLRVVGVQSLLVGADAQADLPSREISLGTVRSTNGSTLEALATDLLVQTWLTEVPADPVLHAHAIVADLVAMTLQTEADTDDEDPRPLGTLVDLGSLDQIDPTVLSTLLATFGTTERVTGMGASDAIAALVRRGATATLPRLTMSVEPTLEGPDADTLTRLRAAVASTSSMLPRLDGRPAAWAALLTMYPATNLSEAGRRAYVTQLDGELGDVRNEVIVIAPDKVSLGGRRSKVPITLVNSGSTPRRVRVRLSSPKLALAQADTVVEVTDRATFEIDVEAKTNGVFPVSVELLTPEGDPPAPLGPAVTFTVQATALTGLGQFISGALALVLATWWVQHWRARRRAIAGRLQAGVAAHPATPVEAR